ncbi:MAG: glycine zipper 2TM domain-containing protein [Betaproteobacteria bacterium]|nr:glycine zipper 2TM domain-containing protein [Betaproteobacteria bacterium]
MRRGFGVKWHASVGELAVSDLPLAPSPPTPLPEGEGSAVRKAACQPLSERSIGKEAAMKLRYIVGAVGIALASAAVVPAYADGGDRHRRADHRWYDRGGDTRGVRIHRDDDRRRVTTRRVIVERHRPPVRVVERKVVVERPVYVDRPVYVEQPRYDSGYGYDYGYGYDNAGYAYPPQYHSDQRSVIGTVGGAVLGAVIGNQVADRHNRAAATAVGAVIGGVLGSGF